MAADQEPADGDAEKRSTLGTFFRVLARNLMFLTGGRGPTPEELDERDDVYRQR